MNDCDGGPHQAGECVTWRQLDRELHHIRELLEERKIAAQRALDLSATATQLAADRSARQLVTWMGIAVTFLAAIISYLRTR
jgi:hypothetical protein